MSALYNYKINIYNLIGEIYMSYLVMNSEECNFIWEKICDLQIIFHPRYSREGIIDFESLLNLENSKRIIIMLDRNLLSSLLKLSHDGYLKDKNEMQIIATLMTMNNYPANAGLALEEFATKTNDVIETKLELREFKNIFNYYPSMIWLRLAEGIINEIPIYPLHIVQKLNIMRKMIIY